MLCVSLPPFSLHFHIKLRSLFKIPEIQTSFFVAFPFTQSRLVGILRSIACDFLHGPRQVGAGQQFREAQLDAGERRG